MISTATEIYGIAFDSEAPQSGLDYWLAAGECLDGIEDASLAFGDLVLFHLCVLGSPPAPAKTMRSYEISLRMLRQLIRYAPTHVSAWWRP